MDSVGGRPKRRSQRSLLRCVLFAWLTLGIVGATLTTGVSPAAAASDHGIVFSSHTVYEVLPTDRVVQVVATYTATNVSQDTTSGDTVRRYYWDGMSIPIPVEATGLSIGDDGNRALSYELLPENEDHPGTNLADITFASNLFYQQTTTVIVAYDLPGAERRGEESTRVNSAYAAFGAYGLGDEGLVDLSVIVPEAFSVETIGSSMSSRLEGDKRIYEATNIENPADFFVFISARNDAQLATRNVNYATGTVEIRYWPGDNLWADFMTKRIESDLPVMAGLIGIEFPDADLEIIETISPTLYGYGGWYNTRTSLIEVTEDLDSTLALHELSHGWFNYSLFAERFILEGLAQEYAARTIEATEGTLTTPPLPSTLSGNDGKLSQWTELAKGDVSEEQRGYANSWYLIRELANEIGIDSLSLVIRTAAEDQIAYQGDTEPELVAAQDDWRRFLDLLEEIGGSSEAPELFAQWVTTTAEEASVTDRAAARAAYQDLQDRGATWAAPLAVRQAMGEWDFATATLAISHANEILRIRNSIADTLTETDTELPARLEIAYETAPPDGVGDLLEQISVDADAAEAIAEAHNQIAAEPNPIERIGRWFSHADQSYFAAKTLFEANQSTEAIAAAESATAEVGDYQQRGVVRLSATVAATTILLVLNRRRKRPVCSTNSAGDETQD